MFGVLPDYWEFFALLSGYNFSIVCLLNASVAWFLHGLLSVSHLADVCLTVLGQHSSAYVPVVGVHGHGHAGKLSALL